MSRAGPLLERFNRHWTPVPESGCWLWTASTGSHGYGQIMSNKTPVLAHRASWEFNFGDIPAGMHVLHKCDRRVCVNPSHLFLGSNTDNIKDKVSKSRQIKGSRVPSSRLDEEKVKLVFYSDGSQDSISERFGISQTQVCRIKQRKIWKHVTGLL